MDDRSRHDAVLHRAFEVWRRDPLTTFLVRVRRHRAGQVRELLADPERVDLETFNRDVWQSESATIVHPEGSRVRLTLTEPPDPETLARLNTALETGDLELHGNYVWRPASGIYNPQHPDDATKLENLQYALLILNDPHLAPIEKARQIQGVRGFGENTATGLVMLVHRDRFAICSAQSTAAFAKLGITETSLEAFQHAAERLRTDVGAEDFLELDLFLYDLAQSRVQIMASMPSNVWWVNQGTTYEQERAGGYLWVPKRGKDGHARSFWTNLEKLKVGDLVIHYAKSAIRALGVVQAPATDAPRPPGLSPDTWSDDGYLAQIEYHPLKVVIRLDEIPWDWRSYTQAGPFTSRGEVKQGYLFQSTEDFVQRLFERFADHIPEAVQHLRPGPASEEIAAIRAAIEAMYPDPAVRRTCLNVFADGIERAHAISPASWVATKPQGRKSICFNVAWAQPCILSADNLTVVFDRQALDEAAWKQVEAAQSSDPTDHSGYTSITGGVQRPAHLPADRLDALLPVVHEAYLDFVATCARRVNTRANSYRWHVPAVVDYLRQELGRNLPQPNYGSPAPEDQQIWLFQANPAVWSLTEELGSRSAGDEETWSVTRFHDQLGPGQPVVLWQGGKGAGIYALGELTDVPIERPTAEFWPDREERGETEWAVPFVYTHILDRPIPKAALLAHPILKDLSVIRGPQGTNFKVTPQEWAALQDLLDAQPSPPELPTLDQLAALTHMERAELEELEELLLEKRQLVLEGPPGSGKTYLAELLARYLAGLPLQGEPDERVETVQFHQSYGYEDFVQGIRPVTDEQGRLQYHVLPGIFMRLCDLASRNPDKRFVLIVDEINRGNLSRIFGELLLICSRLCSAALVCSLATPFRIRT